MHCYYNKERFDMKTVKEILAQAEKKSEALHNKISKDIKRQEDRLEKRIKERKLRSENGSVHKMKIGS